MDQEVVATMTEFITGEELLSGTKVCGHCSAKVGPDQACWTIQRADRDKPMKLVCHCPKCGEVIGTAEPVAAAQ